MKTKLTLFILSYCFQLSSQVPFYQDLFNGAVNVVAISSWDTTNVIVNDFGGSSVRKAFLISGRQIDNVLIDVEYPRNFSVNGLTFTFGEINRASDRFTSETLQYGGSVNVVDVTNAITTNVFNVIIPLQTFPVGENNNQRYYGMSLVVLYDNPTLNKVAFSMFLNNKDIEYEINHIYENLYPIDIFSETAISFSMGHMVSSSLTALDGSYVEVNSFPIGLLGGPDEYNISSLGTTLGQFTYSNQTIQAIGNDDTNDSYMSESDVLANISSYVLQNDSEVSVKLTYQNTAGTSLAYSSNPIFATYMAYSTPCEPFDVSVSNDTSICLGSSIQLVASSTNPTATYEWQPATGLSCTNCPNPIFTADSSMFYTVRIWNSDSCSVVRPLNINVRKKPSFNSVAIQPTICGSTTGRITVSALTAINYSLNNGTWQNGSTFQNLAEGTYTLSILDAFGCQNDTIINLGYVNETNALFNVNPNAGPAPLNVNILNISANANMFEWYINNELYLGNLTNYTFDSSGVYSIQLIATNNYSYCIDSMTLSVIVYDSLIVAIPNVFTPNGDGINDFYSITANQDVFYDFQIVNRWGNNIISGSGDLKANIPKSIWDATTGTTNSNDGVYFILLKITDSSGQSYNYEQFITLKN